MPWRPGGNSARSRQSQCPALQEQCSQAHKHEFHLKAGTNFFMLRLAGHWNRLPRGVGESLSLETFEAQLEAVLCHLPWQVDCSELSPKVSSNPRYSVHLRKCVIKFSPISRMLPAVSLGSTGLMALFVLTSCLGLFCDLVFFCFFF